MSNLNVIIISKEPENFAVDANNLKEALSIIKLQKGAEYVSGLLNDQFKFLLADSSDFEKTIALNEDVLFSDFDGYDTLFMVKDIEGNEPLSITAAMMAAFTSVTGITVSMSVLAAQIIGSLVLGAFMMGINMLMQALSPTPEFSSDPAAQQNQSNLFNGAPIIRNQGGSVPLIFGNPYCGAVLISSGAFSEEVSV